MCLQMVPVRTMDIVPGDTPNSIDRAVPLLGDAII